MSFLARSALKAVGLVWVCSTLAACGSGPDDQSSGAGGATGGTANAGTGGGSAGSVSTGGASSGGTSAGGGSGGTAGGLGNAGSSGSGSTTRCSDAAPFGTPQPITELNTDLPETGARLTSDELNIVFERDGIIFQASRSSRGEPFGEATEMPLPERGGGAPWISDDLRAVLFEAGGYTEICTRPEVFIPFECLTGPNLTDPYAVGGPNGRFYGLRDGIEAGPMDNWYASDFEPVADGMRPVVTPDELTLFFGRNDRTRVTHRASTSEPFPDSVEVPIQIAGAQATVPSFISPDGCRLYVDGWYDASGDLYVATR